MPNIEGQKRWSEVRLLETHELARGGVNGNLNEQAQALADRTELLMEEKASKTEIVQGVFEFGTYAEFDAAKLSLPLNCTVIINEIPTGTQTWGQGTNRWNGTTLTKSAYDPLTQAKADATVKANAAKSEAIAHSDAKTIIDPVDTENLYLLKDSSGKTVASIDNEGKVRFIGLPMDLVAYLQALDPSNRIVLDSSSSKLISLLDSNGLEVLYQDKAGDIFIPKVGNLTQILLKISQSSVDELLAVHKAGEYIDALRVETMPNVFNTGILLRGLDVGASGVFPHTVNQLRGGMLARVDKYKYVMFFDAKGQQGDFGLQSQGVATVTIDPATMLPTVSNIQSLANAFTDTDGLLKVFAGGCGVKTDSGKVIGLYLRRYSTTEHKLYMRTSDDDGVTWNAQVDLTDMLRSVTGWNLLCPTSKGIVKRFGKHKGRIVFPFWTRGAQYIESQSIAGYIYSDDDGITWEIGEFVKSVYGGTELCIAEYLNGDMLFVVRTDLMINKKAVFRHSDITKQFNQLAYGEVFTDSAIMSGVIQGDNIYDGTACKFMFTTCRDFNRYDLQVHTSYDGGETWQTKLIDGTAGVPVAYTNIESIDANNLLLTWESGFANDISYHTISLNNIVEV